MFLVPYNRLSEDQKAIIRRVARNKETLFVQGPPGSGKTLISLYILKDMVETQSVRPLLLMYNHSLYGYLSSAIKELELTDNVTIATKDKYFWDLASFHGIRASGRDYESKYTSLLDALLRVDLAVQYDIAVVDEVQDLRKEEWELVNRLSSRITSLGDFDQGLYQTNLTREDVQKHSVVERLKEIFRFHKNIAKIAQKFSRSSEKLEDKVSRIEQKNVQLIDIKRWQESETVQEIVKSLREQRGRIGLITFSKARLKSMFKDLQEVGIEVAHYRDNQSLRNHDFSDETPLLVTCFSAKGLEFEHVVVFGFEEDDSNVFRKRQEGMLDELLYVALTRSNSNLYVIRHPGSVRELQDLVVETEQDIVTIDELF